MGCDFQRKRNRPIAYINKFASQLVNLFSRRHISPGTDILPSKTRSSAVARVVTISSL